MITKLKSKICFISHASVGGYEEKRGALGEKFDFCDTSDRFGQKTWETAEGEMGRVALNIALGKAHLSHEDIDLLVAGDLQNQCVASSAGLNSFGAPFVGIYGACSTCTEGLMVLSSFMENNANLRHGSVVTTSHNAAAERQFRTPIEYGGQRARTAQWTATAGGAFILGREGDGPCITAPGGWWTAPPRTRRIWARPWPLPPRTVFSATFTRAASTPPTSTISSLATSVGWGRTFSASSSPVRCRGSSDCTTTADSSSTI